MEDYKLKIAFISFTRDQTIDNFKSFVEKNKDNIAIVDMNNYSASDKEGNFIKCVFKGSLTKDPIKYDQVIISDDKRAYTTRFLNMYNIELSNQIPEQFVYISDIV